MGAEPRATTDPGREFSRVVIDLMLESPFFAHVAGGLQRLVLPERQSPLSIAVRDGRYALAISPRPFALLSPGQRKVALEHELLHLVLGHPARAVEQLDPGLFGLACDLVVNQLLRAGPPLPGAFTLQSLRGKALPPDLSADEYLVLLKEIFARTTTLPGEGQNLHPWAISRVGHQLAEAHLLPTIREAAQRTRYGDLPAGLVAHLEAILAAFDGTMDWKRVLRLFSTGSMKTRIRNTLRRRSKRYGTFPGLRVKRLQRVAVCVDTSGSITDETLSLFFAEIHGIWRAGAEVEVFEVDAALQRAWVYRGVAPSQAHGRGGTAFDPGLEVVRDAVPRFDACIYLTDGCGPAPTISPRVRLLWIVTPGGRVGEHLKFGSAVQMRVGKEY